jgi:hypothetical protein
MFKYVINYKCGCDLLTRWLSFFLAFHILNLGTNLRWVRGSEPVQVSSGSCFVLVDMFSLISCGTHTTGWSTQTGGLSNLRDSAYSPVEFLDKFKTFHWSRNRLHFLDAKDSLLLLQGPGYGPYSEPDEPSLTLTLCLFKINFNVILQFNSAIQVKYHTS